MFYKNISCSAKTFHGVTFQPGEIKEVSNYINDKFMIIADKPTKLSTRIQQKPSSDKQEKNVPKVEEQIPQDVKLDEPLAISEGLEQEHIKEPKKSSPNKEQKS